MVPDLLGTTMISNAVLYSERLTPTAKVLRCVLRAENPHGFEAPWPGDAELARILGVAERTLSAACRDLSREGWLALSRKEPKTYRLTEPDPGKLASRVTSSSSSSSFAVEENSSTEEETREAQVATVFDHWVKTCAPPRTNLSPSRRRIIEGALKETDDDVALLCRAIDGMVAWHAQRGGALTLSRVFQSRPGSSPLGEIIDFFASLTANSGAEKNGEQPALPPGLSGALEGQVRAALTALMDAWHTPSTQSLERATNAESWLAARRFRVARDSNGRPRIEAQA